MANANLWHEPHRVASWLWWYEEPSGITVVVDPQAVPKTENLVTIRWKSVRAALARKDRKEK